MQELKIKYKITELENENYVFYEPINEEVFQLTSHGAWFPLGPDISQIAQNYSLIAREEILKEINNHFPNKYI